MFSAVMLAASCLSDDTETDITYYNDTAITSFSLGTLKRYLTTKAKTQFNEDGTPKDSIYTVSVTGSKYKFYIDQIGRKIYNTDSLPQNTDAAHVLCSVNTKNNGFVVVKDMESDTLRYFSESDSIDFTKPREFRVYASSGVAYRNYTVEVNVHKEDPDSFRWNTAGTCPDAMRMQGMKALTFNDKIILCGTDGSKTSLYTTSTDGASSWTAVTTNITLDAQACRSMTAHGNLLFTVSGGKLIVSTDGQTWHDASMINGMADLDTPSRLIGSAGMKLYALDAAGNMVSSEINGAAWQTEKISGDKADLPTDNICLASVPLATDKNSARVIMTGTRRLETYPEDSVATVWNKIEEYAEGSQEHGWMSCNEQSRYQLPRLANLKMTKYGDLLVAIGGKGEGTSTAEAFSQIYVSRDNGLTWHADDRYVLPEDFTNNGSNLCAITADKDNFLWIICGGNGTVWRGRLNKLGWKDPQTSFDK